MQDEIEEWRPITEAGGKYEVSNNGRVRNADGHVLSPNKHSAGYLAVHMFFGGKHTRMARLIHRLVAKEFLPQPAGATEVNHKNFNKHDNRLSNLEWVSHLDNVRHTCLAGRQKSQTYAVVGTSLTDMTQVRFASQSDAEKHFAGRNTSAVHNALVGKAKSAYGYSWSRV